MPSTENREGSSRKAVIAPLSPTAIDNSVKSAQMGKEVNKICRQSVETFLYIFLVCKLVWGLFISNLAINTQRCRSLNDI